MVSQAPVASAATIRTDFDASAGVKRATSYAYLALALFVLANFFNYVDRTLPAIVGQRMKLDMHLSDAQLGFLLGTAFAVFYGVIGLGMGRIADAVNRPRLMAYGLAIWSVMTAVSGLAGSFVTLAAARLGVGVGEASATPCAYSLLSQAFPAKNRAMVLALYLVGTHLGVATALIGGGLLLQHWTTLCHAFPDGACHIASWRAAFLVVGAPGVALACVIAFLGDPGRVKRADGPSARAVAVREFSATLPPLTFLRLYQIGGWSALGPNLAFTAALAAVTTGLCLTLGDPLQWIAMAIGAYAVTTWAGVLRRQDTPLFRMTLGCATFLRVIGGTALCTCIVTAVQVWSPAYAMRIFHASPAAVGVSLGLAGAATGALSTLFGGALCDAWKRRDGRAPVWITMGSLVTSIPAFVVMMRAESLPVFVAAYVAYVFLGMMWAGPTAALAQDLVLPRMHATSAAAFSLLNILIGSGIGPFMAGKVSTLTGSLSLGLSSVFLLAPPALISLAFAARRLSPGPRTDRQVRAEALETSWLVSGFG